MLGFVLLLMFSTGMFVQWLGMTLGGSTVSWWAVVPALSIMLFSLFILEKLRGKDSDLGPRRAGAGYHADRFDGVRRRR